MGYSQYDAKKTTVLIGKLDNRNYRLYQAIIFI